MLKNEYMKMVDEVSAEVSSWGVIAIVRGALCFDRQVLRPLVMAGHLSEADHARLIAAMGGTAQATFSEAEVAACVMHLNNFERRSLITTRDAMTMRGLVGHCRRMFVGGLMSDQTATAPAVTAGAHA